MIMHLSIEPNIVTLEPEAKSEQSGEKETDKTPFLWPWN